MWIVLNRIIFVCLFGFYYLWIFIQDNIWKDKHIFEGIMFLIGLRLKGFKSQRKLEDSKLYIASVNLDTILWFIRQLQQRNKIVNFLIILFCPIKLLIIILLYDLMAYVFENFHLFYYFSGSLFMDKKNTSLLKSSFSTTWLLLSPDSHCAFSTVCIHIWTSKTYVCFCSGGRYDVFTYVEEWGCC